MDEELFVLFHFSHLPLLLNLAFFLNDPFNYASNTVLEQKKKTFWKYFFFFDLQKLILIVIIVLHAQLHLVWDHEPDLTVLGKITPFSIYSRNCAEVFFASR